MGSPLQSLLGFGTTPINGRMEPISIFVGGLFSSGSFFPGPSGAGDVGNVHANLVGPIRTFHPHTVQTIGGVRGNFYFDPAAFSTAQCDPDPNSGCKPSSSVFPSDFQVVTDPKLATYGTLPRNFFRGPGRTNLDLSIAKKTSLVGEKLKLEMR